MQLPFEDRKRTNCLTTNLIPFLLSLSSGRATSATSKESIFTSLDRTLWKGHGRAMTSTASEKRDCQSLRRIIKYPPFLTNLCTQFHIEVNLGIYLLSIDSLIRKNLVKTLILKGLEVNHIHNWNTPRSGQEREWMRFL